MMENGIFGHLHTCKNGYEPNENNTCQPCSIGEFSLNGEKCIEIWEGCVEGIPTTGACTVCIAGYELKNSKCEECTNLTYSQQGTECIPINNTEHCIKGSTTEDACVQCQPGYAPDWMGKCSECERHQYSNGDLMVWLDRFLCAEYSGINWTTHYPTA